MRFYVASRFGNFKNVRAIHERLRRMGHTITYDWTNNEEFDAAGELIVNPRELEHHQKVWYAIKDLDAAMTCDRMILLCDPDMGGAYIEVGLALSQNIRIYTVGKERRFTIFWALPNFIHFDTEEELFAHLTNNDRRT